MNSPDLAGYDRTRALARGLRGAGLCILYHDRHLALRMIENAPAAWPPSEDIIARGDAAIFDAETAAQVVEVKRGVIDSGLPARMEVPMRAAKETTWYELHIEADHGESGGETGTGSHDAAAVRGLVVSAVEITERKRREEAMRALLYEVSHRSRNLLAIVQSVLGHSARDTDSVASFERKFRGRIAALAHSQDLITRSNWQGVRFHPLIERQLSEFRDPGIAPPLVVGPDTMIGPNAALYLGLALHELAANSARFGVFALGGDILIETDTTRDGHRMTWTEDLALPSTESPGRGFGQAILTQIVPRAVNGRVEYQIAPRGIVYRIDWPEAIAL